MAVKYLGTRPGNPFYDAGKAKMVAGDHPDAGDMLNEARHLLTVALLAADRAGDVLGQAVTLSACEARP